MAPPASAVNWVPGTIHETASGRRRRMRIRRRCVALAATMVSVAVIAITVRPRCGYSAGRRSLA